MSDPDIRTLTVRFSAAEQRLLEDFAQLSGGTVETLIREALFLPPMELGRRRHLRLLDGGAAPGAAAPPQTHGDGARWTSHSAQAGKLPVAGSAVAHGD